MATVKNKVTVCITGDIDYFESETVDNCLSPLFKVLDEYNVKMTLPITAKAVKDYPRRAEYVLSRGHEVAIHGDVHEDFLGTLEEQVDRLQKAKQVFRDVLGFVPGGFRAPHMRHDENTYSALIETGFLYDSSKGRNEVLLKLPATKKFSYDFALFPLIKPLLGFGASARFGDVPARPFLLQEKLVEIPVTGPPDWHLILFNAGPKYLPSRAHRIAEIWLDVLKDMKKRADQLFVVQVHPAIMSPRYVPAIDLFLKALRNDRAVEIKTLEDVTKKFLYKRKKPGAGNRQPKRAGAHR